jgi:hypothetical protein
MIGHSSISPQVQIAGPQRTEDVPLLSVAHALSLLIAALMAIASAVGLLASGTYRDNDWARSGFRGNDLVSLALAVPLMLGALSAARRGSVRAHAIWLGTIAYTLYNYLFYLFGTTYNELFLVYVALVALSLWALILGLTATDPVAIRQALTGDRPSKWVTGNMAVIALFLGGAWLAQSIRFLIDGTVPQNIEDSGIHTSIVFALDLAFVVPAMIIGAWAYWSQRIWGATIAAILVIKAAAYTIALISMSFFAAASDVDGACTLTPVWVAMSVISLASCWILFGARRFASK